MSIESWRDGYQRGFLDGVEMRKKWDDEQEYKLIKSRLERLAEMREEWDEEDFDVPQPGEQFSWQKLYEKRARLNEEQYEYYRAGMTKTFDEVVFPDKCQECDGSCVVCE